MNVSPVASIKRRSSRTSFDRCIICQDKGDALRVGTEHGKVRIREASVTRKNLHDTDSLEIIDRITNIDSLTWADQNKIKWHKNCYSSYTSKERLGRLKNKIKLPESQPSEVHTAETCTPSTSKTRAKVQAVDFTRCIFCQSSDVKQMNNVTTFQLSENVIKLSQNDSVMRVRLAGVNDLIATEGKYHLKCLSKFRRKSISLHTSDEVDDEVMKELKHVLEEGLSYGHVYDMTKVWNSYCRRIQDLDKCVPSKYQTRKQSFYEDVKRGIGDKGQFVRPLDKQSSLLLYPTSEQDYIVSQSLTKGSRKQKFETFIADSGSETDTSGSDSVILEPCENTEIQEIVHAALKIRTELQEMPGHDSICSGFDNDHVEKIIPNTLYIFLRLLFGGMALLDGDEDVINANANRKVCSIAQDIIYGVSNGTKLTPKHVGLGLALHQATRSKALVELFHAANHTVGITTIRRIDNAIANNILEKYMQNGGVYIPSNIEHGVFVHCSCDNIDVLESTLDGRNTFHSTQMVVWQRQTTDDTEPLQIQNDESKPSLERSCNNEAMKSLHELHRARMPQGRRPQPVQSADAIDTERWFTESEGLNAHVKDTGWLLCRQTDTEEQKIPAWRAFNESTSQVNPPMSTIGMLPILQAPADEYDTITTVIDKFVAISNNLGQTCTVITCDQPLYAKGKELTWANHEMYKNVVFRLGGLHVCFNFLKSIGQHMDSVGLDDLWIDSGVYPPNVTANMLEGKAYYRAVRAHTLTYEALWRLRWRTFRSWLNQQAAGSTSTDIVQIEESSAMLTDVFKTSRITGYDQNVKANAEKLNEDIRKINLIGQLEEFDKMFSGNKNYVFWKSYMDMVDILLLFIRAEREGNWKLHLEAFAAMLPWMTAYDHLNYARWGPVYLAEMKDLENSAPDVYKEFMDGNFVVKRSNNHFSQIPTDQATEWINKLCKMNNGIIGITRTDSARDKFCITWAFRSNISQKMRAMYADNGDDEDEFTFTRVDFERPRVKLDESHVQALLKQLDTLDVFCCKGVDLPANTDTVVSRIPLPVNECSKIVSIVIKDIATNEISQDLVEARSRGKACLLKSVEERLIVKTTPFFSPMKKLKLQTFASMYQVQVRTKQTTQTIKADRQLMQRLFNAANAGRTVEIASVLKHELSQVPLSLAKVGGEMNQTTKSDLLGVLTTDYSVSVIEKLPVSSLSMALVIDGHALIQILGKPDGCVTFGDYANVFVETVLKNYNKYTHRIDVIFDRYTGRASIKTNTRSKRSSNRRQIRRMITSPDIPLPQSWDNFLAMSENKSDIARFLSEHLETRAELLPREKELVIGGGYQDVLRTTSNKREVHQLSSNHEEADTRMILHALDSAKEGYKRIVIKSQDTDVLLLLIHHLGQLNVEVWMMAGTSKKTKLYPVHTMAQKLPDEVRQNILGFHALTGCDTTSSFSGIGKKTCWKRFIEYPDLLSDIGRGAMSDKAERFVCLLYGVNETSVDEARCSLFVKAKKTIEKLPPTSDALKLHIARADYQAGIWIQAGVSIMDTEIKPTDTNAWREGPDGLEIVWKSLETVPNTCIELTSCGCKSKCKTIRCKCFKMSLKCTPACGCDGVNCANPID